MQSVRRSRRYCVDPDNVSMFCTYLRCIKYPKYIDFCMNRKTCEWLRDKLDINNKK